MKQPDCQSLPSGNISELPTEEVNRQQCSSVEISELPTEEVNRQQCSSVEISELPTSEVNSALQLKFQSYQLQRSTVLFR